MFIRTPEQQARLKTIARETTALRPLPAIALRLLDMAASTRFSAHDLAMTVNTDQALTTRVLRLANSPAFGMPRRVISLREAVVLLGFREVRSIALAACVIDATHGIDTDVLDYSTFWRNSLIIGMLARVLAEANGGDRETTFTAGVVHNVGRLSLAQQRPEIFANLVQRARSREVPLTDMERMVLGFTDAELGATVARGWRFPDSLCDAVAHHDAPLSTFDNASDLDAIVARAALRPGACHQRRHRRAG